MGRRKADTSKITSRIDAKLHRLVNQLLDDPIKPGRVKHGALGAYLNRLIAEDMRKREAIGDDVLREMEDEFQRAID